MPWEVPITVGDQTYPVQFNTEAEPTQADIDEAVAQILQSDYGVKAPAEDTGQSRFLSGLSNVGRGALSIIPGAVGGLGYLAEPLIGPGLKKAGAGIEKDIETLLPVNPAYEEEFSQKAAGAIGQAGGMLLTGGVAGALGKGAAAARGLGAAEAAAAGTRVAGKTLLGSGFLSGSREGGQAAERYGMEGVSAYTRALLGGAIEGATEKYLFGLGTELAPVKKFLGDTLEKGVGGLAKMGATEAGEEAAAQAGGNIATKVLAPEGVQTPGIGSGVGEAAALGGVAGLALGGVTGLLPSGEKAEPATAAESVTVESGEMPLPTVLKNLDEKVTAAVEANADVLPATAAALKDLESGLTDAGEVEGDARQGLPIRRSIAAPGQEGVSDLGSPEGDVLSLVPKKSPAAPPAEPSDATEGQPTPGGVGAPPVVTNEPQTPAPAEQPVSAAETPVATDPEASFPETEKVVAPKAETEQGAGMTQRDTSKPEQMTPEETAALYITKLKGVEHKGDGIVFVPEKMMTPKRRKEIKRGGNLIEVKAWADVTGNPSDRGYAIIDRRARRAFRSNQPVSAEAVDAYGITLPKGYVRQGDLYVFAPEAPPTQEPKTKPEDASKNQVEEAGGTPPVEGKPAETRPEGQAQEGAAQRSREGEEGVLTPEAPFAPDDKLLLRSPFMDSDEEVTYRGPLNERQSVVVSAKGVQYPVDTEWLRRPGTPYTVSKADTPTLTPEEPSAVVKEVAAPEIPKTKKALAERLAGKEPSDFTLKQQWKKRVGEYMKRSKADLEELLSDRIAQEQKEAIRAQKVKEWTDYLQATLPESDSKWRSTLSRLADQNGIQDWQAMMDNKKGEEVYRLASRLADRGVSVPTSTTPEFGSSNTVFTKEKAEEARKVLRRKLGGQFNLPAFDPELFSAATNYAGFLIEGGVRSIADFSANMVKEFGEGIRPYIKGLYNGVRDIAEFEGMDDASKVNEVLGEATPAAPQKPAARPQPDLAAPAPAPETPVSAPEVIGIANARIDESRKALGLPPIERPVQEVYGDKELWNDAGAAMEADSGRASYLVASLIKNPRPATTLETAILLREQVARMDALQRASIELVNATPENQEAARQKYDYAVMAKTEADEAAALAGAEQGRAFRARQLLSALDYSLANMTTTLQGASQRKLTDAEVAEVVAESEKINAALKAVNDLKESSGSVAEEESIFAEVVKEAKAEARLTAKDTVTEAKAEIKSGKSLMDVLNEKRDAARLRIRKRGGNLNVNLNPADLVDYAIIAASYIAEGAVTLKDVTVKMVKDFGAAIEQHMPKIFSEAQALKSELDKAVVEEPLEGETKAKGKKPALEQLKESGEVSGRLIHDLVKEKVKSGLTTLDDVFKAVTKDVQTVIPEITERELRDMFSGYGKVKFPSQEELPKKVRELRRLAQLASAIEDAQKKIAPLRSGPQRDEASLAVREAQKELHRIMKEQGIERAPGPRALKSALDAAKTRLRNQIEELEKQVAERKRTPASKRDITYDAETNSLIEKRDALKKTLDEVDPVLPPTPQELIKNALKELDKTIAELERRVKERDVSEKPKTETPLTEQLQVKRDQRDALRKQLNDIRVEIEGEPYLTQEEINERAERRLVSEINEIERQIAEKDFTPEQARKPENTAALIRLKARRDVLREQFNALKEQTIGKKVKSEAERVEIAVKALEKSIDDLNARIAKGDVMPKGRQDKTPQVAKVRNLRAERDSLRQVLTQMRKAQEEAAKDPVEEQIKRDRKYLETQIKNYEKKLASGDFRPRPKKAKEYDARLAAETLKLRKLKEAWAEKVFTAQLNSRGPAAKAYDFGKQVLHTSRAVLTSFDVSAVFRQGGFIVLGNPIRAFKNLVPMFQSLASENAAERTKNELEARPNFKLYQQSKLYLADFSQNNMNQQEELFMSRWLNKIPSYLLGGAIRGSQRAYVTFLNRLRADTFDAMLGSLQKGPTPTTEEINAISNYINIATGRGDLGKFQQAGEALNTVFFAAKLVTSRFQILGGLPFFKASGRTKNLVLREYAKFLTGAALVYALGMAFQDDDDEPLELDPRSSDFLKLRYGDTRVDPLGGLIQASVFLSRVVSGEKKQFSGKIVPLRDSYRLMNLFRENPRKDKVRYGADNTFDVGANFLRSKFSPSFGAAVDLITGETVIGEKTTPTEIGYKMIMPLTFGEAQKTLEAQGMSKGSALTIVSLFGMGVQTYD